MTRNDRIELSLRARTSSIRCAICHDTIEREAACPRWQWAEMTTPAVPSTRGDKHFETNTAGAIFYTSWAGR